VVPESLWRSLLLFAINEEHLFWIVFPLTGVEQKRGYRDGFVVAVAASHFESGVRRIPSTLDQLGLMVRSHRTRRKNSRRV